MWHSTSVRIILSVCVCVSTPVSEGLHSIVHRGWNARKPQGGSGPFSSQLIGCEMTLGRQSHVPAFLLPPFHPC